MDKKQIFNTAVYIRLSREDGDKIESDSVGNQKKFIMNYIKVHDDLILYDIYVDDGYSGTNFDRPDFKRMLVDIEAGYINCVIVKDLSRFGRDYIDTGKYLERYFPDNGVRFISISDNIDSMKHSYDMLLPIKNIFNEQYARDISKKIHATVSTKQKNGEFIGSFASYGYKKSVSNKNQLVIDEYAAGIVRKIFNLFINGYGKKSIAKMLNDESVPCPSEYKKLNGENYQNCNRLNGTFYWTFSTINYILHNELYCGNMVQGRKFQQMHGKSKRQPKDKWVIVPDTHEAIIDRETWDKAQNLLNRRTRNIDLSSNVTIFAGFLKCGDCGRALAKRIGSPGHGDGIVKYYCGTYKRCGKQFCTPHMIPHNVLENIILDDLKTIIKNVDNLQDIANKNKKVTAALAYRTEKEIGRINAELQKVRKFKKAIYEDYIEGLFSKDEYLNYRQDYNQKENLLIQQLTELEKRQNKTDSENVFESPWVKRLLELRNVEKLDRDIIVEMIDRITVYENRRIKITYNFSDELENLFQTIYDTSNENIG